MSDHTGAKAAKEPGWESGTRSGTADESPPKDRSLDDESGAYLDDIDAMSLEELKERLPQARAAVDDIESKLEEFMALRDAAIICAAAMTARLAALQQAEDRREQGDL